MCNRKYKYVQRCIGDALHRCWSSRAYGINKTKKNIKINVSECSKKKPVPSQVWDDQTGNASYREPDAQAYYTENQLKLLFTIIPCTKTLLKPIVHLPQRHMRTSVDEARQEMCVWKHPVGRVRDLSSRLVILDIRLLTFLLSAPSTVSPDTGRIVRHFVLCFFFHCGIVAIRRYLSKKKEKREKRFLKAHSQTRLVGCLLWAGSFLKRF